MTGADEGVAETLAIASDRTGSASRLESSDAWSTACPRDDPEAERTARSALGRHQLRLVGCGASS